MAADISQEASDLLEIFKTRDDRRSFPVVVEDVQLFVNKHALAGYSPFFETALFGDFREANGNDLKLPGKSCSEVVELFSCLFSWPGRFRKEVSLESCSFLWMLADEYNIEVSIVYYVH